MSEAGVLYANAKALHELLQESRAENAELRELVREMWGAVWACAEQRCARRANDCYRVWGNSGDVKGSGECWFEARMAQMGIEVER